MNLVFSDRPQVFFRAFGEISGEHSARRFILRLLPSDIPVVSTTVAAV